MQENLGTCSESGSVSSTQGYLKFTRPSKLNVACGSRRVTDFSAMSDIRMVEHLIINLGRICMADKGEVWGLRMHTRAQAT